MTKDNFISEFSKVSFKEDYLVALQKIVSTGNFTISQDSFELGKELFWLVSADENTVVKYTSRLKVKFKEEDQAFYSTFVKDSSSGILEFKGSGNFEVLSYEECVSGLAQRKIDLAIPDKLCYWEDMTEVYTDKCTNLKEEDVAEIFQKKAEYRQLNNPDWPSLNTDGDFCVPVIYDCDAWMESNKDVKTTLGFVNKGLLQKKEDPVMINLNPYLKEGTSGVLKNSLLHEGLHAVQNIAFGSDGLNIFNVDVFYDLDDKFYKIYPEFKDITSNSPNYQRYIELSSAWEYVSQRVEIDPRLSEVHRWWFDQTVPNCEVLYTSEEFGNALKKFLSELNTAEEYQLTKKQLNDVLEVAEKANYREEVWSRLISRGPGIASNTDMGNDGTMVT